MGRWRKNHPLLSVSHVEGRGPADRRPARHAVAGLIQLPAAGQAYDFGAQRQTTRVRAAQRNGHVAADDGSNRLVVGEHAGDGQAEELRRILRGRAAIAVLDDKRISAERRARPA